MEAQTSRKALRLLGTLGIAGSLLVGAMSTGCGSSTKVTPGGAGGTGGRSTGTGGSAAGGGTSGASDGGTGFGGTSVDGIGGKGTGGVGGRGSGGAGTGGVGTGGISEGGVGGAPGTGGVSAGGQAGAGTGGRGSGGIGTGGARTGGTGGGGSPDAGSADAPAPPVCGQLTTQAACDERSDCHSVFHQQSTCTCSTPGCCMTFWFCTDGATARCNGTIVTRDCSLSTPLCQAPYVVGYGDHCYQGCVPATKCSNGACPATAPADGTSCGATSLMCVYQDCAGAGVTQARCLGGLWGVQTVSCTSSLECPGGGTTSYMEHCGPGEICARTTSNGGAYQIIPSCIPDSCAPAPLSNQCVPSNCGVASPTTISCSTPSGPGGAGGGAAGGAMGGGGNAGAGGGAGTHIDAGAIDGA
jgi:hypothetical protein